MMPLLLVCHPKHKNTRQITSLYMCSKRVYYCYKALLSRLIARREMQREVTDGIVEGHEPDLSPLFRINEKIKIMSSAIKQNCILYMMRGVCVEGACRSFLYRLHGFELLKGKKHYKKADKKPIIPY